MKIKYKITRLLPVAALFAALAFLPFLTQAAVDIPDIDEATFSDPTTIDHPFFSLPVGKEMRFESEDGEEEIVIEITGDTNMVMGVETLVYRDRVYEDGELVEDTRDYLAQDDDGNVWYFGEDVDNYEDGELDNHDGAWLAGEDGAEPGYWMPMLEKIEVGYAYREEWYEGEAEDEAEIVSVDEKVSIELGTYTDCIKTKNTTPLEPDVLEYKYYCKQLGGLVLEEEEDTFVELVHIKTDLTKEDGPGNSDQARVRALQAKLLGLLQQLLHLLTR